MFALFRWLVFFKCYVCYVVGSGFVCAATYLASSSPMTKLTWGNNRSTMTKVPYSGVQLRWLSQRSQSNESSHADDPPLPRENGTLKRRAHFVSWVPPNCLAPRLPKCSELRAVAAPRFAWRVAEHAPRCFAPGAALLRSQDRGRPAQLRGARNPKSTSSAIRGHAATRGSGFFQGKEAKSADSTGCWMAMFTEVSAETHLK